MAHLGYTVRPWREVLPGLLTAARRTPIRFIMSATIVLGGGALFVYGTYAMLSGRVVAWTFVLAVALPVLVYAVARTKLVAPVPVMLLFRRTFARSLIPVLAVCVLAFGLFADIYLSHAEDGRHRAAQRLRLPLVQRGGGHRLGRLPRPPAGGQRPVARAARRHGSRQRLRSSEHLSPGAAFW